MPTDIRRFFGGGGDALASSPPKPSAMKQGNASTKAKGKRGRKVIDDSDDDESPVPPKKSTPQKPKTKAKKESPKGEVTSTSDYFASNPKSKPARSTPVKPKKEVKATTNDTNAANGTPRDTPRSNGRIVPKPDSTGRTSSRKKAPTKYVESASEDDSEIVKVDDDDDTDDIFNAEYGKRGKDKSDAYAEGKKPRRSSKTTKEEESDDFGDDDVQMKDLDADDEVIKPSKSTANSGKAMNRSKKSPAKAGRKRKSTDLEDEDDFLSDEPKSTKSKPPAKKPRRPSKKEDKIESKEIQDIYDSIPTIRAPTPPPRDEDKKFNFANRAANSQPPPGAGSKEIPIGAENCLAGLTFVFTGVLDSISREDGQALVKRYGGKVTSGPSSKTSYVVLGNDAGPKKLETIQKFKLKTINEDGLFELIRRLPANGGDGKAAEKYQEKQEKEQEKIQQMAAEIEAAEKKAKAEHAKIERAKAAANSNKSVGSSIAGRPTKSAPDPNDQLWTVKYAPTSMQMICGNKGQVEKLQTWLRNWRSNAKTKFHKAGPSGTGVFRAVMIYGPPGIGKTTAAHLVAKMEGYDVVETNASDTRSKKLVEGGLQGVLDTTSLMGYFAGDGRKVSANKKKLVLIMDEVDGMSAGDRGGVGALASIAKKTNVPLILICNERKQPKMKPFDHVTYDLQFRKPTTEQVRARMMTICFREGVKIPTQVLDSLIEGSGADIRRIINMISTAKLDQQTMDYDQSKDMNKAWEKNIILKPWDLASKILSPSMFSAASKATLNDKTELYFNDHEFSFLMLQENYLRPNPSLASNYEGNERKLKLLELADNAAESFSDGDLIDRMIHGTQQHWSLMPSHAVASFVRPASFMHGPMMEGIAFTKWLGQNSKQGKLTRLVKEIQGHMRLRASGDRHEIRQQYMPALWNRLVRPLQMYGQEKVSNVIDLMDSYFLTKEDWDSIVELGLGPMDEEKVKIDTKTKSAFTRNYNLRSHPLPFMKASSIVAPRRAGREKPDLEEAVEASDDGEEITGENEVKEEEDEALDLKKDKYVKVPKKKAAAKKSAGKKGKKGDDEDEESEVEEKPKKGKGRPKAKGKA